MLSEDLLRELLDVLRGRAALLCKDLSRFPLLSYSTVTEPAPVSYMPPPALTQRPGRRCHEGRFWPASIGTTESIFALVPSSRMGKRS